MRDKGKTKRSVVRNKQLGIIAGCIVLLVAVTAGLTTRSILASLKEFPGDGYILVPSEQADVTTEVNEQYYFSAGTSYRERLASTVSFKDTSNHKVTTDTTEFVHYLDGSLGSFTKGVVLELTDVANEQVTYYGVSDKTTIVKNGQNYEVSYMGDALDMSEFIWKITDDKYMLVSPQITLHLNQDTDVTLEDYVQLQYVEGGIVRLVHQQGTYQTVADNSYLTTDSGVQLNLMSKNFMVNGEEALSLNDMVIDASSNLNLDENDDSVKIPSFNVVNGKDGANGASGEEGEEGAAGESGSEGETGANGEDGADGGQGVNAQDGFDGLEGTSGSLGYDGKDGDSGVDAPTSTTSDGIAAIDQKQAPVVSLDTEKYTVGPNSISFNLAINDPEGMLESDLLLKIYNRADMSVAYQQTIPRGATSAAVSTNALLPDTEYVIVVSGSYSTDSGLFDTDFFTKVFATDSLGIKIEKVQITDSMIKVKTTMSEDSMVGTYQLALYDSDGVTKISTYNATYSDGQEFEFSIDRGLDGGRTLLPNTKYTVKLLNIVSKESAAIGANVSLDVRTLKTTPYYKDGAGNAVAIAQIQAKAVTSERYQTVTVSLDTAIQDPCNGITGYRYELYKTSDMGQDSEPVAVQEVQGMQPVSFNVDRNQGYVGRVVVLFHDNEKEVELPSGDSDVISLSEIVVPTVTFEGIVNRYDSIEGYIRIEDTQRRLLPNITADYPLVLNLVSEAGVTSPKKFTEADFVENPNGESGDNAKWIHFSFDGLRRNTVYTLSLLGPFNSSDQDWNSVHKADYAEYYLAGTNINTGSPTRMVARFRETTIRDDGLFAFSFGITADSTAQDAAYEVGNLERVSFRLTNLDTGTVLGEGTLTDTDAQKHASDFSQVYSDANTTEDGQQYSAQFVLTANTFNANDSRVSGGGNFRIEVIQGLDYTSGLYNSEYTSNGTNTMDWKENSEGFVGFDFVLEESHVQTDPNNAVEVTKILNRDAGETYYDPNLSEDTVVGLKITPDYRWQDVRSVTYYIYEVTGDSTQPQISGDLNDGNWKYNSGEQVGQLIQPIATKTFTLAGDNAPGIALSPWTVYFKDMNNDPGNNSSNNDGHDKPIFERGKRYFVRYVVKTDQSMSDSQNIPDYPNCVYPSYNPQDIPYYRSQMFELERQIPVIQRYLDDTNTDGTGTTQTWQYRLVDPDGAVKAYADKNSSGIPQAKVIKYDTYPSGVTAEEGGAGTTPGTELAPVSLGALYDDTDKPKTEYMPLDISVGAITDEVFYSLEIPYLLYTNADVPREGETVTITKLVDDPVSVKPVSEIQTDIIQSSGSGTIPAAPTHPEGQDYFVSGLMVKGLGTAPGIEDQCGYRIKLTLQGRDIFRVAALRVTLTSNTVPSKSIVFDPVELQIATGQTSKGNNYGVAYLDYAPIVKAGLDHQQVTVKVEAYYDTNQAGLKSFNEAADITETIAHTGGTFVKDSSGNAWALKRISYITDDAGNSCEQEYLKLDGNGNFAASPKVSVGTSQIQTALGSVYLPTAVYGGTDTTSRLKLQGAVAALCTTGQTDANIYTDILKNQEIETRTNATGIVDENNYYYTVEKLELQTLQIDVGTPVSDYREYPFTTGDGMPGIRQNTGETSIGRNSATIKFDTKGQIPFTEDQALYIYLYQYNAEGTGTKIPLCKYRDDNGIEFYQKETAELDPRLLAVKDDGHEEEDGGYQYGTQIQPIDAINGKIEFILRGLDPGTRYYVQIQGKDKDGSLQELFDYGQEVGGVKYSFTTNNNVELEVDPPTWTYNTYVGKSGQIPFAIKGYDGMYMRIYYKVYQGSSEVRMHSDRVGKTYVDGKGYLLGTQDSSAPYYSWDKTVNDKVIIDFSPGTLQPGTDYKVIITAYESNLSGTSVGNTSIGQKELTITTPSSPLKSPYASVRAIPQGSGDKADLTVTMTDANRVIYDNKYTVEVLDRTGATTWSTEVNMVPPFSWSDTAENLTPDTSYRVKVTAKVDLDNDAHIDETNTYTTYTTFTTTTEPTANIVTSRDSSGNLVLEFTTKTNFDQVATIMYSIDSYDGRTNYANGSVAASQNTITISNVPSNVTCHYSIQYYDAAGTYLGGTNADFK